MGLIATIEASCRDCYKCVRHCPVKAIKITREHAEVVPERCINDGRCVIICPQQAKKVESYVTWVRNQIKQGMVLAASLAPSFVAAFEMKEAGQMVTALKKLGFKYVGETAAGAEVVAREHRKLIEAGHRPLITSSCPAIVNLMEIYFPGLLPYLAPVDSPMTAHGKMLKEKYGEETETVFIGPCIAKKREESDAAIDAVLTFRELADWLAEEGIAPSHLESSPFDEPLASGAHTFPAPGGLAKTAAYSTDLLAANVLAVDGMEESIAFLHRFGEIKNSCTLIELLACRGGCLAGPGMTEDESLFSRRRSLLGYAEKKERELQREGTEGQFLTIMENGSEAKSRSYTSRSLPVTMPSEEKIRQILARTGKHTAMDELNCGACGYNSCREKAIAVATGMAEVDMCIPFMRAKAESKADLICRMTPNAIFVVDGELRILEVNPAAEEKFHCRQDRAVGMEIKAIMDPRYYEEALHTRRIIGGEVSFPGYGITARQSIFYIEKEDVLVGIYTDITAEKQQKEHLNRVTAETLEKAQEVIDKQMQVAQEIAGLLGETTAETKVLMTRLMNLFRDERWKAP